MDIDYQHLNEKKMEYCLEIASGAFEYIEEHTDQNIANVQTTIFNVLTEMLASFLCRTTKNPEEQATLLAEFITLTAAKATRNNVWISEKENEE